MATDPVPVVHSATARSEFANESLLIGDSVGMKSACRSGLNRKRGDSSIHEYQQLTFLENTIDTGKVLQSHRGDRLLEVHGQ